jgi:hypothetical protein
MTAAHRSPGDPDTIIAKATNPRHRKTQQAPATDGELTGIKSGSLVGFARSSARAT